MRRLYRSITSSCVPPASVGRRGVRQIIELDLDASEQAKFDASVATLKAVIADVSDVIEG